MKFNVSMPIEVLNLSVRSYNCLKRGDIHTIGELMSVDEYELRAIRNMGNKSLDEIAKKK